MRPFRDSVNKEELNHQPFFSIVITTYNRAQILKRALNSMICQTENDWEAIIIDDESIDDTYSQVLPYIRSNAHIRYFRNVHSGEAGSKNAGINLSNGRFISFLDSDDEYHPVHLQSRKLILTQYPSVKFLHGGAKILGNQYVPDRYDNKKLINLNECAIGGTFFVDRNLLLRLGGFRNIFLGTDADLYDRVSETGVPIRKTKIPTYIYHHENEDSITNILSKSNAEMEDIYSEINSH